MRLSRQESELRDERAYREHEQACLDAFMEGKRAGMQQLAVSLCPEYPSEAEREQWRMGRLMTLGQRAA